MKAINLLKKNKALGLDNLTNELIIAGKQSLIKPLCKLFNLVFRTAKYPQRWTLCFLNQFIRNIHLMILITIEVLLLARVSVNFTVLSY